MISPTDREDFITEGDFIHSEQLWILFTLKIFLGTPDISYLFRYIVNLYNMPVGVFLLDLAGVKAEQIHFSVYKEFSAGRPRCR